MRRAARADSACLLLLEHPGIPLTSTLIQVLVRLFIVTAADAAPCISMGDVLLLLAYERHPDSRIWEPVWKICSPVCMGFYLAPL